MQSFQIIQPHFFIIIFADVQIFETKITDVARKYLNRLLQNQKMFFSHAQIRIEPFSQLVALSILHDGILLFGGFF